MSRENKHWHLFNDEPEFLVTNVAATNFINAVEEQRKAGFGFVPFIGAGLSAPSGIPLIWELKSYLERCIALALGVEERGMTAWNPRTDHWPPFYDRARTDITDWVDRVRDEFERRRRTSSRDPEVPIFQEAIGAMAEWRTALLFLSRLVRERRSPASDWRDLLALDAPAQAVISACIREVMRGKHPTLGHRMLAMLAGLLRFDIVITTNFDDLLEQAFSAARNPLIPSNVELNGELPAASDLSNQRAIVKLHGTGHSLRADYTLDAIPPEQDRWRFLEYLLSPDARSELAKHLRRGGDFPPLPCQNHLLVMGFSAGERRTRTFIEHAWRHLDSSFKVFWLCHTPSDVERIQTFSTEYNKLKLSAAPPLEIRERSTILRHTNLGLLFLQLFQTQRLTVPPRGIIFPSLSRLAMPPLPNTEDPVKKTTDAVTKINRALLGNVTRFQEPGFPFHKLAVAISVNGAHGLTSVCGGLFDSLASNNVCLWFDMNDVSNTGDLFEKLLDAAYFRLGREYWIPVHVTDDPLKRAGEIDRLAESTVQPWIIFLNARETPGANVRSPKEVIDDTEFPNQWLDDNRQFPSKHQITGRSVNTATYMTEFLALLTALCGPSSPRISVILLCRSNSQNSSPLIDKLLELKLIDEIVPLDTSVVRFQEENVVSDVLDWTLKDGNTEAKRQFLHGLVLLQRTRYLATIWSEALWCTSLQPANVQKPSPQTLLKWLADLEKYGLVRRKAGGFIWIHARVRTRLRLMLGTPAERAKQYRTLRRMASSRMSKKYRDLAPLKKWFANWRPHHDEPTIQEKLAGWYHNVLIASEAPAALFEAVYHACQSAQTSLRIKTRASSVSDAIRQLEWAASELQMFAFLAQTQGYSRGSCRYLEFIRDRCKEIAGESSSYDKDAQNRIAVAVDRVILRCTEIMRAIGREVGEITKAYIRHNELWSQLTGETQCPRRGRTRHLFEILFNRRRQNGAIDPDREWLRWCRWSATLAIESRTYSRAFSSLLRGIYSITSHKNRLLKATLFPKYGLNDGDAQNRLLTYIENISNFESLLGSDADVCVCGVQAKEPQQIRIEVVRLIEQAISCALLELSAVRRTDEFQPKHHSLKSNAIKANLIKQIRAATDTAKKVIDHVLTHDKSSANQYTSSAKWCESRILMHKAICSALEAQYPGRANSDSWKEAMQCLIDAEVSLSFHDPRRRGTDLALIELFRAEVRLREADSTLIACTSGDLSFWKLRRDIEDFCRNADSHDTQLWREMGSKIMGQYFSKERHHAGLQEVAALVADAMRFLERAEGILQGRRKNVWWTTWFFERRLNSVAMMLWATVPEKGTNIPVLGLEHAPRRTDTLADEMLLNALRMVRLDSYRLATVVRSYANCAFALRVRLMCGDHMQTNHDHMNLIPHRQKSMFEHLEEASRRLSEIAGQRENTPPDGSGTIDSNIADFVESVAGDTVELLRILESPLG